MGEIYDVTQFFKVKGLRHTEVKVVIQGYITS